MDSCNEFWLVQFSTVLEKGWSLPVPQPRFHVETARDACVVKGPIKSLTCAVVIFFGCNLLMDQLKIKLETFTACHIIL